MASPAPEGNDAQTEKVAFRFCHEWYLHYAPLTFYFHKLILV